MKKTPEFKSFVKYYIVGFKEHQIHSKNIYR